VWGAVLVIRQRYAGPSLAGGPFCYPLVINRRLTFYLANPFAGGENNFKYLILKYFFGIDLTNVHF